MKFAILGAGSAGQGLASYLSLKGYDINLFNLESEEVKMPRLKAIRARGGIEASGVIRGFARISKVTTDIGEAIRDADVVIFTIRAFAHRKLFELCLPYFKSGQIVIVSTGYWISLRLRDVLDRLDGIIAETTLLPLVSEAIGPAQVKITGVKTGVKIAAFPATRTSEVIKSLKDSLPLVAGENIIETNLDSFNPTFHTPIALFNLGTLERENNFEFYHLGVTPKIADVIDLMDKERLNLATKFGLRLTSGVDTLKQYYDTSGATTHEIFSNCRAYKGYVLPNVFDYIREDVPYGLVPIASLCDLVHVSNQATKAIISAWSLIDKVDYWEQGITTKQLGIGNMEASQIIELVTTG